MNRRRLLTIAAAAPMAFAGRGRAYADDHLKWAVFTPDHEVTFRTVMKPYAEAVQKETDNAVVFDLFPNGALGRNPGQQTQMVLDGVADIAWAAPSYSPGRFPDTEVLELAGQFKNLKEGTDVATRMVARSVFHDYRDFVVLGMFTTAPYSIHTNFPVHGIADLKGKTLRASSANESAALRALGAVPIGMPVTEIPEAISRRTISGTTSHMSPFFDFGLDRVTNNHFFIGLGVVPLVIVINRKRFEALPAPVQAVMLKHGGQTIADVWSASVTAFNEELFNRLKSDPKQTIVIPSAAELEAAQALFAPVRDSWVAASDRHKELKAELDAELTRVRSGGKG
jgi:TRAP-type C4-dicarboxylate transport system substrate-binding protein